MKKNSRPVFFKIKTIVFKKIIHGKLRRKKSEKLYELIKFFFIINFI